MLRICLPPISMADFMENHSFLHNKLPHQTGFPADAAVYVYAITLFLSGFYFTVSVNVIFFLLKVLTVIVVLPFFFALILPLASTVAIFFLEDVYVIL